MLLLLLGLKQPHLLQRLQMLLLRGRQGHPSNLLPSLLLLRLLLLLGRLLLLLLLLLGDGGRTKEGFRKVGVEEGERAEIIREAPSLIS